MKLVLAMLLLFVSLESIAGSQQGRITALRAREVDGLIWLTISGPYWDKPVCATQSYWVIKNETGEPGKRQHAMLLAALMSGKRVQIYGAGTCSRWVDGEDIMTVELLPD